jgi:hypothetical protein
MPGLPKGYGKTSFADQYYALVGRVFPVLGQVKSLAQNFFFVSNATESQLNPKNFRVAQKVFSPNSPIKHGYARWRTDLFSAFN